MSTLWDLFLYIFLFGFLLARIHYLVIVYFSIRGFEDICGGYGSANCCRLIIDIPCSLVDNEP